MDPRGGPADQASAASGSGLADAVFEDMLMG
jgi:hypothetical protein